MATKKLNLYKIYQEVNTDYDSYDSAVVAAVSEDDAKKIHPSAEYPPPVIDDSGDITWCSLSDVKVQLIGTALKGI
jgi:hypothetical protein